MSLYELSIATSATASGAPALEIVAGTGSPMSILEIELVNTAATAYSAVLGRPGNTPAGGTPQTATKPINRTPGAGASLGGLVIASWGTAPTVPAAGDQHRRLGYAAAIGNGSLNVWNPYELMVDPTRSGSLILWNLALVGVMNVRVKWQE